MAEGEEKTEAPSELRLKEARKKGQVVKSMDVLALVCLSIVGTTIIASAPFLARRLIGLIVSLIQGELTHSQMLIRLACKRSLDVWFLLSIPVILSALLASVIGNVGQFGFLFTTHPLKPDIQRINPVRGLKKIFSKDRLVELLKQLLKFAAVFVVMYQVVRQDFPAVTLLYRQPFAAALGTLYHLVFKIFSMVLICFLVIAIFDWFWSRYSFLKSMRMSKHEVKKEYIQQEGDPHIRQERHRQRQETLESIDGGVDSASVVITNPTHLAIAIRYDEQQEEAPRVCGKGVGLKAKIIIEEARRKDIPIIRNIPLARDLQWLDIDEDIPPSLYESIAEVLLFVHELNKQASKTNGENIQ